MKVMKFGGTSVGTPQRMKEVTTLVTKSGEPVFVVLSAMAGTTNSLVEISDYLYKKNPDGANEVINRMEQKYMKLLEEKGLISGVTDNIEGVEDWLRSNLVNMVNRGNVIKGGCPVVDHHGDRSLLTYREGLQYLVRNEPQSCGSCPKLNDELVYLVRIVEDNDLFFVNKLPEPPLHIVGHPQHILV